jgi:hypothetical protein
MSSAKPQRRSPYQGLIPYGEDDAPFFIGREKETRLSIANLFASPLTLLYGESGVGKSSVLRAGVAFELRQRDSLLVTVFSTWQGNPVQDLKAAVLKEAAKVCKEEAGPSDRESLSELLSACSQTTGRHLMLILDQFEEYFLYHPLADSFTEELPKAILQTEVPISFLISVREDSLAKLDRFESRIPNLFDNYLRIEHLGRDEAQAAINEPISLYNKLYVADGLPFSVESDLVNSVLDQVQTGQVTLAEAGQGVIKTESSGVQVETPYLQLVMTRLWDEEIGNGSRVLRKQTLDALGGAEFIVRTHLDQKIGSLKQENQDIAAKVFHYLVTPSGSKIAHTVPDLAEYAQIPEVQLAPVMEELARGDIRILRGVAPPLDQPDEPRYEIFHDVLAAAILDWRNRYVQIQERVKAESLAQEQRRRVEEQSRIAKRFRRLTLALAVVCALIIGLAFYAFRKQREASLARQSAEAQKQKALEELNRRKQLEEEAAQSNQQAQSLKEKAAADTLFKEGVNMISSDTKAAREKLKDALARYQSLKSVPDELHTLSYLGQADQHDNKFGDAEKIFLEVKKRWSDIPDKDEVMNAKRALADLYFSWGEVLATRGDKLNWAYRKSCKLANIPGSSGSKACDKLKEDMPQASPKDN